MSVTFKSIENKITHELNLLGLFSFGWFEMPDGEYGGRKAVLIGNRAENDTHPMWEVLKVSPEFADGQADPMNRWTKRNIDEIADWAGATALYPFGDTLWPFQQFAKLATGMQASPLGILIDPEFGLWHAFRAVLVFDENVKLTVASVKERPCDTCAEKPCLSACPVNAFSAKGFDVVSCRSHLETEAKPDCMSLGCRARAACPVGLSYGDGQIRFHMKAFIG